MLKNKGRFMKKAFTLAEVLITLMIIGIVAALTIPSVISNYQQQEFKTGLKKAVSVLNEAIQTNISLDGETPYENSDLFTYLQRHMSVIKTAEVWTCATSNSKGEVNSDGNGCSSGYGIRNLVFYTADGMRFEYDPNPRNFHILHESGLKFSGYHCGSYGLTNNFNNTTNTPCKIMVDVNGDKKPNPKIKIEDNVFVSDYFYPSPTDKKLTDVFNIMITDEKAIPFGVVAQRAMYSK